MAIGFSLIHVLPGARRRDPVRRVQPRRRADRHRVARGLGEHRVVAREPRHALPLAGGAGALLDRVAHRGEREPVDLGDRLEVVAADAPAADERDAHRAP
jgi:hypothetical protein